MSKSKSTPADQLFNEVRKGMQEVVPVCRSCGQAKVKIAPIARQIGITSPTLEGYVLKGKSVSQNTLGRFVNFLAKRSAEQEAANTETA